MPGSMPSPYNIPLEMHPMVEVGVEMPFDATCNTYRGSCTPVASIEIPEVSIEVVQRHEKKTALFVLNEQANLIYLRDAIGTYVAWPLSLITLRPKVAPSSSKGLRKETGFTKESIVGPYNKGVVCNSSEVYELDKSNGKEFYDIVGKENIWEVIQQHWLSASSINLYIRYLCEAYLHETNKASKFSFISLYEMDEKLNPNPYQHIAETWKRHMDEDHLVFAPYSVG
ncbi:uncharacterized protein LOC113871504 [Abrus precatorius]|uniref:Uncharacterized protein LOC113871504 n=1 Tax=Abrus precatorius TaxID=3816 RepID=A0A8B8M8P6_ABRPR|nr:uncharacterized protein LOC113871504 [Abrus precatorius]